MADEPAPAPASSRFKFEGEEYEFKGLRLREAIDIQQVTGHTIGEFEERVTQGDIVCIAALLWILQRRNKPGLRFDDVDGDLNSFEIVEGDDAEAEQEPDEGKGDAAAPPPAPTAGG